MRSPEELIKILDDYLSDYSQAVNWTEFRQALRDIREILAENDINNMPSYRSLK